MNELTIIKQQNKLYVDSREMAEMIEKNHSHLLRDIKKYKEILDNADNEPKPELASANFFIPATYKDTNNQDKTMLFIN